jgi:V-type H+-transporting ATPase subunit C
MNWLKVNFNVAFTAWIHVKALRTFIESVLRYGLPVNFQAAVVKPYKSPKKVQTLLNQLYEDLDTNFDVGKEDDHIDLAGIVTQDYHPYVFFKLPLDLIPK